MKKTATFKTLIKIAPNEIRHFMIELVLDANEDFCILHDLHLGEQASSFLLTNLSWVYEDRSGVILSNCSCTQTSYPLSGLLLPRGSYLQAEIKNFSSVPQFFTGSVDLDTIVGSVDEVPKPSLVERCKRWFTTGLEVAARDRLAAEKKPPVQLESSLLPSVRESARQIAASLASLVELPAMAAALYWRSLSEASLSEASLSETGSADDPQPTALERVSFPIDVFVAPNLGKCRYRLGEDGVKKIDLLGEWLTFTVDSVGGTEYEVDVILMPGTLIERSVGNRRTIVGT